MDLNRWAVVAYTIAKPRRLAFCNLIPPDMRYKPFVTILAVGLLGAAALLSGCASGVSVTNTLPEDLKENIKPVKAKDGVRLNFTPIPAGEQFKISVGAMDYSLNRVFQGMVSEMLTTKFDTLNAASSNVVDVQIVYLNVQEENFAGSLSQMDMAVAVEISDGFRTTKKELEFSEQAEIEGYGLQSGQIRNLLLRFTLAINKLINDQYQQG